MLFTSLKFWIGVCVGVVLALLWVNRKALSDLYYNRTAISAGGKVVGGAKDVWSGIEGLWGELHR